MSDDVTLTLNGRVLQGWDSVRVTRGIERMPSDFDLGMTERYPDELNEMRRVANPGGAVQLKIGADVVVTGYIDRIVPSLTRDRHEIRVLGRGRCQDLVDCSAEWPGGQISGANALEVAKKLVSVYPPVSASTDQDASQLVRVPQLNLNIGETSFEILERICRYSGLLLYETPDGNLFLTRASSTVTASGVVEGQNIERAVFESGQDRRYSEVNVYLQTMQNFADTGANLVPKGTAADSGVTRNRKLLLVSEQVAPNRDIAQERATWEVRRRAGRAKVLSVVVDSWRDATGSLWLPNTLVPVSVPTLKLNTGLDKMLIAEVTYSLTDEGTQAFMTLMPAYAFAIEPTLINPVSADLLPNQGR